MQSPEDQLEQDKAAEAREARRRRILENSNKRLGKITGREHNEEIAETVTNGIYPDPEMERDIYEAPTHLAGINSETQDIFDIFKSMQGNSSQFSQSSQQPPLPQTPLSKFLRSKLPIVIIALIVYMLFTLNLDVVIGSSVFSSLIVWEIFEFFMTTFVIKEPLQQGGIVNILFAFGGFSQQKTQLILKLLGLFNKIIRDIAIFMFTFVITHLLYSFIVVGDRLSEILDKDFSNLLRNDEL